MLNKRILLVDDDKDHTFGIEQRLNMDGFEVIRAYNAKQAWEILNKEHFDGIIIDIMLPSNGLFPYEETDQDLKTGALLCRKIKHEYSQSIKIVGLTNRQSDKIKKEFLQACGGDEYFEKNQLGIGAKVSNFFQI